MSVTGTGGTAAAMAGASALVDDASIRREGLSPRQQELDRRYAFYSCNQYAPRRVAWDGSRVVGQMEHDSIALAGYVPPGFYVANSETLPIQFRRPTTPYYLSRVIVDRFTGLLFGQKRHPKVSIEGDPDTEAFVNAVIEEGRLWAAMLQARTYGGATGTAIVGFKLLAGRPQFEVFDSRWCLPKFADRASLILSELEYRYEFKHEVRDPATGDWIEVDFWYRRIVDQWRDIVFEPVPVDPSKPPRWVPATVVEHGLGFCPIVWIQNQPGDTTIDGDSDCLGIYELVEAMDRLIAQSERAILSNADPTVVIATDAQMGEVRKGSNNALKLPAGSSAQYMEMSGSGVTQAREQVEIYRKMALEITQCVLEVPEGQKTATEVERSFAAMLARADTLREQYGELGVKRLVNMVLVAAAQLAKPRVVDGSMTRYEIRLPKKADGMAPHLGPGPYRATLSWPPYFEPSLMDATIAVQAATGAKTAGLVDDEHAAKFVASYFQVEDVGEMIKSVREAALQGQAELERMVLEESQAPMRDEGVTPAEVDATERRP